MIRVKKLGLTPYNDAFMAMQSFTKNRSIDCPDELWSVQHPSVFTQGLAGKSEHVLVKNDIPIIQSDRGGQITYHGPGQLVIYPLLNLKRHNLNIRDLVCLIEKSIINVLKTLNISAYQKDEAPGVYVKNAKIASLGLRIKRGFSYHGLALNIQMDLTPFKQINPCGLHSQAITQTSALSNASFKEIEHLLLTELLLGLGHNMETVNTLLLND
tara:strand:+ start:362 stop:1000 length:639 start_codon:yes stop_codon:yes gene_type:complete